MLRASCKRFPNTMGLRLLCGVVSLLLVGCYAAEDNATSDSNVFSSRELVRFIPCAVNFDFGCALDKADDFLQDSTRMLMVQADQEALKSTGRSDSDEDKPSALMQTLSKLINEFVDVFKSGLSGFFRNAKENDDDDDEETDEEEQSVHTKNRASRKQDSVEPRGKKKKKKLVALIKLLLLGAVIKAKLALFLKLLAVKLQLKFFLVALAGLLLNAARFYLDLKKGHQPQKVIYYEHAQHQHHYEGGEEDWGGPSSSGSYWGRSYDENEEKKTAQDMAYSKQKPYTYSIVNSKPNYSW